MIQKHPIKKLDEMFHRLPDPIQEFIVSPETATRLNSIGEHHSLKKEEVTQLGIETGYALMGMLNEEEFINDLSESLHISDERASAIYNDLEESLFKDIDAIIERLDKSPVSTNTQNTSPRPPQNLPTGAGLPSLIDTRLSGMTRMPQENTAVSSRPSPTPLTAAAPTIPNSVPRPPQQLPQAPRPAQDTSTRTTPEGIVSAPQKPTYKSEDPYREKL